MCRGRTVQRPKNEVEVKISRTITTLKFGDRLFNFAVAQFRKEESTATKGEIMLPVPEFPGGTNLATQGAATAYRLADLVTPSLTLAAPLLLLAFTAHAQT